MFKDDLKSEQTPFVCTEKLKEALGYSNYSLLLENDARFTRELFISEISVPVRKSLPLRQRKSKSRRMKTVPHMYKILFPLQKQVPTVFLSEEYVTLLSIGTANERVDKKCQFYGRKLL